MSLLEEVLLVGGGTLLFVLLCIVARFLVEKLFYNEEE